MGQDYDAVVAESQQLVLHGRVAEAVDLLRKVHESARDHKVRLLLGDAYRTKGDFTSAHAAYREVDDRGVDASPAAGDSRPPYVARLLTWTGCKPVGDALLIAGMRQGGAALRSDCPSRCIDAS